MAWSSKEWPGLGCTISLRALQLSVHRVHVSRENEGYEFYLDYTLSC